MKKSLLIAAIVGGVSLTGCATYQPTGVLYNGTTTGMSANALAQPTKTGQACNVSVLGLVASGNASIQSAKNDGDITKVSSVDYSAFNVLGIFGKYCTIVKGE